VHLVVASAGGVVPVGLVVVGLAHATPRYSVAYATLSPFRPACHRGDGKAQA
jgi:hypothetical protein